MAAVSLFHSSNMADVTSCGNTLLRFVASGYNYPLDSTHAVIG